MRSRTRRTRTRVNRIKYFEDPISEIDIIGVMLDSLKVQVRREDRLGCRCCGASVELAEHAGGRNASDVANGALSESEQSARR